MRKKNYPQVNYTTVQSQRSCEKSLLSANVAVLTDMMQSR